LRPAVGLERRLLDLAPRGGGDDVTIVIEAAHAQDRRDAFALDLRADHVDQRPAARGPRELRELVDLAPVAATAVAEEHEVVMRAGDEELGEEVALLRVSRRDALAAASLAAVLVERSPLDVALMADGDDHQLLRDQVLGEE